MKLTTAILSSVLFVIAGCASLAGEPQPRGAAQFAEDPRLGEKVDRACFTSRFDGFGETTDDTAIIEIGRDHYLVETFGGCFNLDQALAIGLGNRSGCLRRGDRLFVSESVFPSRSFGGRGLESCKINSIYEWDPDAEAEESEQDSEDENENGEETAPSDT